MTIEELLGYSAAQLKDMSDADIEAFFAPKLKHIRPEFIPKESATQTKFSDDVIPTPAKKSYAQKKLEDRFAALMQKASDMGIQQK